MSEGMSTYIENEGHIDEWVTIYLLWVIPISLNFSLGFVGKIPTGHEAETYDLDEELPVFMSVGVDRVLSDEYTRYLKKCNDYFINGYKNQ